MRYLLPQQLMGLKDTVDKLDVEVCGVLTKRGDVNLEILIQNRGQNLENRNMCTHSKYSEIIFHTHNYSAKSYPSKEDVIKVVKHDLIQTSIVFTRWGIWSLSCARKIRHPDEELTELVGRDIDKFYFATKNGREYNREAVRSLVDAFVFKFSNIGLEMRFEEWDFTKPYIINV
jgi:hypothetical protein